ISDLQLVATAFKFDNPPEPGAHARLTVSVHNPTEAASGPIVVSLPAQWLTGYRLVDATPGALDRVQAARALRLTFDGPPPGGDATFSLAFVTTAEVIDSPDVTVVDALGRTVGAAHPSTEAPTPRPGP